MVNKQGLTEKRKRKRLTNITADRNTITIVIGQIL